MIKLNLQLFTCGTTECMTQCQAYCESECEFSGCESSCQSSCEDTCMSDCESSCETTCQVTCQSCEGSCETSCENACQYACENYCMTDCESCETACLGTCLDACQVCEGVCQTICEIYCEDTCLASCQSGESVTQLPTPTIDTNATVKTSTSLQITVNPVSGADTYYARINGGIAQASSSRIFTFYNLIPNTQYYIEIKCSGAGYTESYWNGYYATTLASEPWEWVYPKTGLDLRPHIDEWIAFCNKINTVRVSHGLTQYSFTLSSEYIGTDKPFYAWIWLQASNAINEINGQVNSACLNVKSWSESQGDDSIIYPWYFENLKTALNNALL